MILQPFRVSFFVFLVSHSLASRCLSSTSSVGEQHPLTRLPSVPLCPCLLQEQQATQGHLSAFGLEVPHPHCYCPGPLASPLEGSLEGYSQRFDAERQS